MPTLDQYYDHWKTWSDIPDALANEYVINRINAWREAPVPKRRSEKNEGKLAPKSKFRKVEGYPEIPVKVFDKAVERSNANLNGPLVRLQPGRIPISQEAINEATEKMSALRSVWLF